MLSRPILRHVLAVLVGARALGVGVPLFAQTPGAAEAQGYVEGIAQATFGNVTSQSYGAEVGFTIWQTMQLFGQFGHMGNVATEGISQNAQLIAGALATLQPAPVTYSVKQPVTFYGGGVRYPVVVNDSKVRPYALGGFGAARVKNDVTFQLAGTDATNAISQYVTLGTDLSGTVTKPMLTLGGGVAWPAWERLVVDFQYRYDRIFTEGGFNVSRAGLGLGITF